MVFVTTTLVRMENYLFKIKEIFLEHPTHTQVDIFYYGLIRGSHKKDKPMTRTTTGIMKSVLVLNLIHQTSQSTYYPKSLPFPVNREFTGCGTLGTPDTVVGPLRYVHGPSRHVRSFV